MYTENQYADLDGMISEYTVRSTHTATITADYGPSDKYGFSRGQRCEMARALESWWTYSAEPPFTLQVHATRITFRTQGQAIRFYLKISGCWLPLSAGKPQPVKANKGLRHLAQIAQ